MSTQAPSPLKRELGRWDLTAIGVNQVIGAGIFAIPGSLAAALAGWSWIAVGLVAMAALLIGLCFAESGSRFDSTGGAYLFSRAAFGRFTGFEVGWMLWVTRTTSWASVINALMDALSFYWPDLRGGIMRSVLITGVILVIMWINIRGIRQSSIVVNVFTIGKLTPLALFIILGLPHVDVSALRPGGEFTLAQLSAAALMLIFAFGGFEVIPVPAGETKNPARAVPFAMVTTILIVAVVMTLVQVVAMGTNPNLATVASGSALAASAALFLGATGGLLMTTGAAISMGGNNMGQALSGSRSLYALAEQGDLPRLFGRVHPSFRTPDFAIAFTSIVALVLAVFSDFRALAVVSAVARLLVYSSTCASVFVLRRKMGQAPFTIPGGPLVPALGLAISVAILYGATTAQLITGGYFLAAGAILYVLGRRR
jgi:amino acid transporter